VEVDSDRSLMPTNNSPKLNNLGFDKDSVVQSLTKSVIAMTFLFYSNWIFASCLVQGDRYQAKNGSSLLVSSGETIIVADDQDKVIFKGILTERGNSIPWIINPIEPYGVTRAYILAEGKCEAVKIWWHGEKITDNFRKIIFFRKGQIKNLEDK